MRGNTSQNHAVNAADSEMFAWGGRKDGNIMMTSLALAVGQLKELKRMNITYL